jgi:peptide methionine sulfoxide reductase MsrA
VYDHGGNDDRPPLFRVTATFTEENGTTKMELCFALATPEQAELARALIAELSAAKAYGQPIVTEVLALANYSAAEDYHQDFFERNPYQGYCMAVAAPKVLKFKKTFARLVRD